MIANTITLTRLLLTFATILLIGVHPNLNVVLIATIAIIFVLDALDGYVARKRNETSEIGELLDTMADRITDGSGWLAASHRIASDNGCPHEPTAADTCVSTSTIGTFSAAVNS